MKYVEEKYAKELHHELTQRLAGDGTTITIEGAGVHWNCTTQRGPRRCSIACFNVGGPEYLTSFKSAGETVASARTPSSTGTLDAVEEWLSGAPLSLLYERFPFVDNWKRALLHLRDAVTERAPALGAEGASELESPQSEFCVLWFRANGRSCQISFYGKNRSPDAVFHWDECELFGFRAKNPQRLAAVLKRWVCDAALPSQMRQEFSWIEIRELADYYEQGNPLLGEFLQSWDGIEAFYNDFDVNRPFVPNARRFVAQMRDRGYDKSLRAGQSMWTLMLSRSRKHGLNGHQPYLAFDFGAQDMEVDVALEPGKTQHFSFASAELTPEVERLLQQLAAMDVD